MHVSDFSTQRSVLGALYDETITTILRSRAADLADRPALRFTDRSFCYGQLLTAAEGFAAGIAAAGGAIGDRVCVLVDNEWRYVVAFFGTILAGRIFVPLNTAFQQPQIEFVARDVEPHLVVTSGRHLDRVAAALAAVGAAPVVVTTDDCEPHAGIETVRFEDFLRAPEGAPDFRPRPSTPMMILYTSGTTGLSKGIIYTHRAAIWFAGIACYALELSHDDVLHTCLPLFHANALLCTVLAGTLVGAVGVVTPRFSLTGYWREVRDCGATVTSMLGSMQTLLWRAEPRLEETEHRLRLAYVAPLPAGVVAEFQERFRLRLATTYGLTDASILTVGRAGPDALTGSCGRAFPDWEVQLVGEDDDPVPLGAVGEMIARPRLPFIGGSGYWRNGDATADTWRNLWHHSGDLLTQDETGAFHYRERKKDSIRKAGENVASFEVEEAIGRAPGVAEAAVFAVPADLGDDEIMAVVVPTAGTDLDLVRLRDHCRAVLPYFAVPRYWEFAERLPLTETSRVKKSELRARGVTDRTWDAGPVRRPDPVPVARQN